MATDGTIIIYTEEPHRCGHCGAPARMQVLTQGKDTRVWKGNKNSDDRWHVTNYLVLKCALCEKVNLVSYFYDDDDEIRGERAMKPGSAVLWSTCTQRHARRPGPPIRAGAPRRGRVGGVEACLR
jgi:hypothetical protein